MNQNEPITRAAFLGLGHMGLPMARNLAAAGFEVRGFDVVPEANAAAGAAGLAIAESAEAAVADAQAIITMFPGGKQVIDAYLGTELTVGLLNIAGPGTLFIDCSTIDVASARQAHALAGDRGQRSVDAPVSGGVVGAENATLTFMVGGAQSHVDAAQPVLAAMGARVVYCGEAGMGQAAKVCNNMILAVSQIAVAEAFVLAEGLGLSHEALYEVASHASGQCWALTTNCPVPGPVPTSPANRDYQPGFAGALMAKDLRLAAAAVEDTGVRAKMGMLAHEIYGEYAAGPGARRDFSGIITDIRRDSALRRGDDAGSGA